MKRKRALRGRNSPRDSRIEGASKTHSPFGNAVGTAVAAPRTDPYVKDYRILCGAPHKMRYVASTVMWRSADEWSDLRFLDQLNTT
jgi:hypothetical protein